MAYIETGHAKNVANFQDLMLAVQTFGASYNPVSAAIQHTTLNNFSLALQNAMQRVNDKNGVYREKIYVRQNAYEQMSGLAMRVVNTIAGLGLDAKLLAQAKAVLAKIRGGSNKKKKEAGDNETEPTKTISVSQMSFDQRKNNFSVLVGLVNAVTDYRPNEEDMQIVSLQKYIDNLQTFNTEANRAEYELTVARRERDVLLYTEGVGALALAKQIKAYIKGAFGSKSKENELIKGIKFSAIKRDL